MKDITLTLFTLFSLLASALSEKNYTPSRFRPHPCLLKCLSDHLTVDGSSLVDLNSICGDNYQRLYSCITTSCIEIDVRVSSYLFVNAKCSLRQRTHLNPNDGTTVNKEQSNTIQPNEITGVGEQKNQDENNQGSKKYESTSDDDTPPEDESPLEGDTPVEGDTPPEDERNAEFQVNQQQNLEEELLKHVNNNYNVSSLSNEHDDEVSEPEIEKEHFKLNGIGDRNDQNLSEILSDVTTDDSDFYFSSVNASSTRSDFEDPLIVSVREKNRKRLLSAGYNYTSTELTDSEIVAKFKSGILSLFHYKIFSLVFGSFVAIFIFV